SSIYILNDYLDRESDKLHPKKQFRPIASGKVPVKAALVLMVVLVSCSMLLAAPLPTEFTAVLCLYGLINITYCFYTKDISILDVISVASGFVLRVEAGAMLIGVNASVWLLLCTGFIALFMAFAKRRDDIIKNLDVSHRPSLKGYNRTFLDICCTVCLTSVLICYALYTNDDQTKLMISPDLYLTIPFVVVGVFRYMQITFVEKTSGDPTQIVTSDKVILSSLALWGATILYILF
ncbi:MAG: UbiA prenyltransferase family protein, partial [Pseudomonadota bacterium]